jgi:MFS family permease
MEYTEKAASSPYPSSPRAYFQFCLLLSSCLLAFVDVQIFAFLVPDIQIALGISDSRIGLIQGGSVHLALALASLPLGLLIDRGNRIRLLFLSVLGWSSLTMLSGLSAGFWQLFAYRIGVGVAEAGLYPAAYSLIGDLFPPRLRARASLLFFGGILVTCSAAIALIGTVVGFVGRHAHDVARFSPLVDGSAPWRLSFFAAGLPGFGLAALLLLTREPARQYDNKRVAASNPHASRSFIKINFWTILRLSACFACCRGVFEVLLFWLPTILDRKYALSAERAGHLIGATVGVGTVSGTILASVLLFVFRPPRTKLASLLVLRMGSSTIIVSLLALLFTRDLNQFLAAWLIFAGISYFALCIEPVLWLEITPNQFRGRVTALSGLIATPAYAVLPTTVGFLSDRIFHGTDGLLKATCLIGAPLSVAAALLLIGTEKQLTRMASNKSSDDEAPTHDLLNIADKRSSPVANPLG